MCSGRYCTGTPFSANCSSSSPLSFVLAITCANTRPTSDSGLSTIEATSPIAFRLGITRSTAIPKPRNCLAVLTSSGSSNGVAAANLDRSPSIDLARDALPSRTSKEIAALSASPARRSPVPSPLLRAPAIAVPAWRATPITPSSGLAMKLVTVCGNTLAIDVACSMPWAKGLMSMPIREEIEPASNDIQTSFLTASPRRPVRPRAASSGPPARGCH